MVDEISSSRASFTTWSGARGLLALDDPGCDLRSCGEAEFDQDMLDVSLRGSG